MTVAESTRRPSTVRGAGYAWYACAVLSAVYLVCLVDRFVMSIAIVPLKAQFKLTDTQLGLLTGLAFAALYCLASVPAGRLVDRVNRRNLIAVSCLIWTAATAACAFAKDFPSLLAFRLLVGVGQAAFVPAALSLLAVYFAREQLGRAVGAFQTALPIGKLAAFAGGGAVLQYFASRGGWAGPLGILEPWRALFLLAAAPGFVALALLLTVREPQRPAEDLAPLVREASQGFMPYLRRHWTAYFLHTAAWTPLSLLGNIMLAWAPSFYVRQHHLTIFEAATLVGVLGLLGGGVGYMLGGGMMDKLDRHGVRGAVPLTMAAALVLIAPATALFALNYGLLGSGIGLGISFALLAMGGGPPGLAGLQLMTPAYRRGIVTAVAFSIVSLLAVGLGPLLIGMLSDQVFSGAQTQALGMAIASVGIACAITGVPLALLARGPVQRAFDEASALSAASPI